MNSSNLRGTTNVVLVYNKASTISSNVFGFLDFDYASDLDKRKSMIGYIFTLSGCAINWKATIQSTIALFTIETKYMEEIEEVKDAIWLKGLVGDLGLKQSQISMFYDNHSTIHLTKNQRYHEKTKRIDVRYHFYS